MKLKKQEDVLWKGWKGGRGGLCDYIISKIKEITLKTISNIDQLMK